MDNKEFEDLEGDVQPIKPKRKAFGKVEPELTELEQRIIAYEAKNQNIPALSAMFRVSEVTIKEILNKKK